MVKSSSLLTFDPILGFQNTGWIFEGDTFDLLMTQWYAMSDSVLNANTDLIVATHNQARDWADNQSNVLVPGTQAFEDAFDDITSKISYLEGGTGFYDKSS